MYHAMPSTSFMAKGAGGNFIWCDSELDLVVVGRWCSDIEGLVEHIMSSFIE